MTPLVAFVVGAFVAACIGVMIGLAIREERACETALDALLADERLKQAVNDYHCAGHGHYLRVTSREHGTHWTCATCGWTEWTPPADVPFNRKSGVA